VDLLRLRGNGHGDVQRFCGAGSDDDAFGFKRRKTLDGGVYRVLTGGKAVEVVETGSAAGGVESFAIAGNNDGSAGNNGSCRIRYHTT